MIGTRRSQSPGPGKPEHIFAQTGRMPLFAGGNALAKAGELGGSGQRLAVRTAWIAGGKRPPDPFARVVFLPFVEVHVVTQENERVGAGTCAEDMAMVVDVAGRGPTCSMSGRRRLAPRLAEP
jgi:hypothetical protein